MGKKESKLDAVIPDAKETSVLENAKKKTNGITAGAAGKTSDIPPEKIPFGARKTFRMIKIKKSEQTNHSR